MQLGTISSASNMQRIAVNILLFTVAMLLMFHPVGAKFSLNFNTLGEKWVKLLSHWNIRLCWHDKGWIVWQWANLMRQQMKSVVEVCFNSLLSALIMLNLWPLKEGEDAVQFANRVRSAIALQGGLTELPWWVMPSLLDFTDYLLLVWLRGASSFSFVTDNIQHNFILLGRKWGSNFTCTYMYVKLKIKKIHKVFEACSSHAVSFT